MRKVSILKRKIVKGYNNKKNWEYSEYRGYPKGTYFGYESLKDYKNSIVRDFRNFYGHSLRKWRYSY